jgi:hypothetical protein
MLWVDPADRSEPGQVTYDGHADSPDPQPTVFPHKCPICNGAGEIELVESHGALYGKACHACDCRGIVWG